MRELYQLEHLVDARGGAVAVECRQELEVAPPAQIRIERRRLDEPRDALERADRHLRVAPEQPYRALGGPDQPEHHPKRSRLSGAVGTEVPVHVAGADGQIDAADGDDLAVALYKSSDFDGRGVGHSARAAASAVCGVTDPTTV